MLASQLNNRLDYAMCFFFHNRCHNPIRPLVKPFSCFILHRAGCLEKWDHSRNPSSFFFLSGRSPKTIRPLAKPFSCFFFLSGRSLETIRPFKKTKTKNKKEGVRVFTLIFLYKTYYTKSKENEFPNVFAP
jgi:hypothetical protein